MDEDTQDLQTRDLFNQDSSSDSEKPLSKWISIIALVLISITAGAPSFCIDNIVPLQNIIVENMKLTELQYNVISSFYSIPNIFFVIFSGIIVDRIGHRFSTLLFTCFCFVGQIFLCLGVYKNVFMILLLGRFIFGIGSESLQVSSTKYLIIWFKGSLLNLSFGIQLAITRLLYFLNMFYSERFYRFLLQKYVGYSKLTIASTVLVTGVAFCLLAVIFSIILWGLDRKYQPLAASTVQGANNQTTVFGFGQLQNLSPTFWVLGGLCFFFFLPFSSYNSISPLYFQLKYGYTTSKANSTLSVNAFISIFLCIIFGFVTGKIGIEILWCKYFYR
uniref:Lysosomal dipeptide transporter MFSD1 n=1 Tax=Henneguya salminicola TaxID=69463 RepID=A0A6G3ME95_HENSL